MADNNVDRGISKASPSEVEIMDSWVRRIASESEITSSHCGILDVYPYCLSASESEKLLSSFEEHNLKYESNFLNVMSAIYLANNKEVIVSCPKIHLLDEIIDEDISNLQTTVFRVTEVKYLQLFVRLATRELLFSDFYFPYLKTLIQGNWELCFPVFSLEELDLKKVTDLARVHNLYVRR